MEPLIVRLQENLKVRIYPYDVIGKYIFVDGVFEPREWEFVAHFLGRGMTVFDLGANLGQYTLLAAKCVGPTGIVHSFEPSSRMFGELLFNVELNSMSETCVLNNMAVSDRQGDARLSKYAPGGEVFGSLATQHRKSDDAITGYEQVETTTLDVYVHEKGISRVDFIKMDIEGAELLALQGAARLLSGRGAPAILVELADINAKGFAYRALDTWDFLVNLGYQMYSLGEEGRDLHVMERPHDFSVAANVVAVKRER